MSGHAQLTYASLEKAFAFLRGSEDEVVTDHQGGTDHPEFYKTRNRGTGVCRAPLPTLSGRETPSFRDEEDAIIARVDRETGRDGITVDDEEEPSSAFMGQPPRPGWIYVSRDPEFFADRSARPARGTCRPRVIEMTRGARVLPARAASDPPASKKAAGGNGAPVLCAPRRQRRPPVRGRSLRQLPQKSLRVSVALAADSPLLEPSVSACWPRVSNFMG